MMYETITKKNNFHTKKLELKENTKLYETLNKES